MHAKIPSLWIVDICSQHRALYQEIFSNIASVRIFVSATELVPALEASHQQPNLVIIDPAEQQFSYSLFSKVPALVVSNSDCPEQIQACYNAGALDYMSKPIAKNALIFKIRKILETPAIKPTKQLFAQLGHLTLKERLIVEFLFEQANHESTRKEIINYVWKDIIVTSKTLDVHLYHLRRKIRQQGFDIIATHGKMRLIENSDFGHLTKQQIVS